MRGGAAGNRKARKTSVKGSAKYVQGSAAASSKRLTEKAKRKGKVDVLKGIGVVGDGGCSGADVAVSGGGNYYQ